MDTKMLTAILVIGLVATMAGAGTYSYFSDTETSKGNTFTAGTLDLNLPSPDTQPNKTTQLDMRIKFDENAGNDFQGDKFNLTTTFTLKQ